MFEIEFQGNDFPGQGKTKNVQHHQNANTKICSPVTQESRKISLFRTVFMLVEKLVSMSPQACVCNCIASKEHILDSDSKWLRNINTRLIF